jgi:hypothetical protein
MAKHFHPIKTDWHCRLLSFCALLMFCLPPGVLAQSQTESMSPGSFNHFLQIGPVAGLTTEWHLAPTETAIPAGATVQFRVQVPWSSQVTWSGASEVNRNGGWSTAQHQFGALGTEVISVVAEAADGTRTEERTVVHLIDTGLQPVKVTALSVTADPVAIDSADVNGSTMRYFFGDSIAVLRQLGVDHYRTSTNRWVNLTATVEPAGFAPLVEWRLDGAAQRPLGAAVRMRVFTTPNHLLAAGPMTTAKAIQLDTYAVTLTGPAPGTDLTDGTSVTFTAQTDPPGLENDVTWLASTKFGSAEPALGSGREFKVIFDNTLTAGGRWLGVRADNASVARDLGGQFGIPTPQITSSPGHVVVSFMQDGKRFAFDITESEATDCTDNTCRAATIALSINDGEPVARMDLHQTGADILSDLTPLQGTFRRSIFGSCDPFPEPNPFPGPFLEAQLQRTFPGRFPPLPFPCPITCPTFPVPGGPCDLLPNPPFVSFIATSDLSVNRVLVDAPGLAAFTAGAGNLLQDGSGDQAQILDKFRLLNEAVFSDLEQARRFRAAATASDVRKPAGMRPSTTKKVERWCNVANAGCGLAALSGPNPVSGFACGFALGWNIGCALFCGD